MKFKKTVQTTLFALGMSAAFLVVAQTAVKVVEAPYVPSKPTVPASPVASGSIDDVIGTVKPAEKSETTPNPAPAPMALDSAAIPPKPVFEVTGADQTVRDVLVRWSTAAGWTHAASHWTIDRDFPIAGTADASVFGADFKEAARRLLSSTELTDRPVQPCFYSNRILRVVPKAELCDKTAINN